MKLSKTVLLTQQMRSAMENSELSKNMATYTTDQKIFLFCF